MTGHDTSCQEYQTAYGQQCIYIYIYITYNFIKRINNTFIDLFIGTH